jgi:hypothetical protein
MGENFIDQQCGISIPEQAPPLQPTDQVCRPGLNIRDETEVMAI